MESRVREPQLSLEWLPSVDLERYVKNGAGGAKNGTFVLFRGDEYSLPTSTEIGSWAYWNGQWQSFSDPREPTEPHTSVGLRVGPSAASVEGNVYLVGGRGQFGDRKGAFRDVSLLSGGGDPTTWSWTQPFRLSYGRAWSTVGSIGGTKLVVAGGFDGDVPGQAGRYVVETELIDLSTGTSTRLTDLPVGRSHAAGAVVDGRLYMIGGFQTGATGEAEYRNDVIALNCAASPGSANWVSISRVGNVATWLPSPMASAVGLAYRNRFILVVGGRVGGGDQSACRAGAALQQSSPEDFWCNLVRVFDTTRGTFLKEPAGVLRYGTCYPCAAIIGDLLFVAGGENFVAGVAGSSSHRLQVARIKLS